VFSAVDFEPEPAQETDEFGKTLYTKTEDSGRQIVGRVADIATKRGAPRAQVALAWMAQKPFITAPIGGASKPHHLDDAVAALEEPYTARPLAGFYSQKSQRQS